MFVRALCKHYNKHLREEGDEFEHDGPLHKHIVPVEELEAEQPKAPAKAGKKGSKPNDNQ